MAQNGSTELERRWGGVGEEAEVEAWRHRPDEVAHVSCEDSFEAEEVRARVVLCRRVAWHSLRGR